MGNPYRSLRENLGFGKHALIFSCLAENFRYIITIKAVHSCTVFWFLAIMFIVAPTAAADTDSLSYTLPDVEVRQQGHTPFRKTVDGSVTVRSSDITRASRAFGEADFIGNLKRLPQVYSVSDYAAGINIDGANASQNQYLISGAPVIYPYRFGGVFSTFNAPHFSKMDLSRRSTAENPPRIGSTLNFTPAAKFSSGLTGSVNAGMTSSSLTLRTGIAERVSLNLSGRLSYIDQVYGKMLSGKTNYLKYSFYDLNADIGVRLNSSDCLTMETLRSSDRLGYDDLRYQMDTRINWTNEMYNLSFTHQGDYTVNANIYLSDFHNRLQVKMPQFKLTGPSFLRVAGVKSALKHQTAENAAIASWGAGVLVENNYAKPLLAELTMLTDGDVSRRSSTCDPQNMLTATVSGNIGLWIVAKRLKLEASASVGVFLSKFKGTEASSYRKLLLTPDLEFLYYFTGGSVSLSAAYQQQPLHQVGFSELGLASNFWLGACAAAPIQRSLSFSGRTDFRLPIWDLRLEAGLYYKKLTSQAEYQGAVIEVVDTDYNPFDYLIISDGYNFGGSIGVSRQFGVFTGEASYGYDDGRRHQPGVTNDSWKAAYIAGHTFKGDIIWHEGNHWELQATFRLASGRRYTPITALYAIGGNIAMEYGRRNSARLPLYQRLDVGATYYFSTGTKRRLRHLVNLSILNAYGHRNVEMQYFVLDTERGDFSLKKIYSLYRFLPSLSYTLEF